MKIVFPYPPCLGYPTVGDLVFYPYFYSCSYSNSYYSSSFYHDHPSLDIHLYLFLSLYPYPCLSLGKLGDNPGHPLRTLNLYLYIHMYLYLYCLGANRTRPEVDMVGKVIVAWCVVMQEKVERKEGEHLWPICKMVPEIRQDNSLVKRTVSLCAL